MEEKMSGRISGFDTGFDPFMLYQDGAPPCSGDAELIVGGSTDQVVGRMAAFMLLAVRTPEGKFPFEGVTVIAPPALIWDRSDKAILNLILTAVADLRGNAADERESQRLQKKLTVLRCLSLDTQAAINAVKAAGENQLLILPEAAKYRYRSISVDAPLGKTSVIANEDRWVPNVKYLASSCIELARSSKSVLVFQIPETPPVREVNRQMLFDVDGLYPIYVDIGGYEDAEAVVMQNADKWIAMAISGRTQEALDELGATNLSVEHKSQVAIQLAHRSDDRELAVEILRRELAQGNDIPPELAARFGHIARKAGEHQLAEQLFDKGIAHVADREVLQSVLMSCTIQGNLGLVLRAYERLAALFPDASELRENREFRLIQYCQVLNGDGVATPSRVGFGELENYLAGSLNTREPVEYDRLLEAVSCRWRDESELATICCAVHAQAVKQNAVALQLGLSAADTKRYERQAIGVLIAVVRRMMLLDQVPREGVEMYKLPLQRVIRYLASHPSDAYVRAALVGLLSVESCGSIGLPLIASLALQILKVEVHRPAEAVESATSEVANDVYLEFFRDATAWIDAQPAAEIGVTRIPKQLVGDNPAGLIQFLLRQISYGVNRKGENADLQLLEQCCYMVCFLAPHVANSNADMDALRLLAGKSWFDGKAQKARDLAEQILELAGSMPSRQRAAWASFADIYQRTRNPIEALVGISCSFACEASVEPADAWQEIYALHRIVRDLNLHENATELLSVCRELLAAHEFGEVGQRRLQTMELGVRLTAVTSGDVGALSGLVRDAANHCKDVMENRDEIMPAAALLAQSAGLLERAGGQIDAAASKVLAGAFNEMGPRSAEFLRAVSAAVPSVDEVVLLQGRLDAARNSRDVTGDMAAVVMSARRLLKDTRGLIRAEAAVVAIELLAERSVENPQPALALDAQWPVEYVKSLSKEGTAVLMLGLDDSGELVSVCAEDGVLNVRAPTVQEVSFRRRLAKWSVKYPYRYGFIELDEGNNEFYLSMGELDVPMPSSRNVLVIAEPVLHQISLNLVLDSKKELSGRSRSIGFAPSLTWFEAARRNTANHNNRRRAWISTAGNPESLGTLGMILARLQPVFEAHCISIDTGSEIPCDLSGSQMAIVTAHGGLTTENRFIHKISDEDVLAESPEVLARALAGVEMVILFVCSGGRVDRHPLGNTTVGLPKLLLDRGCRTVIASPWPLAAVVTGSWLEAFMVAWDGGETAATAVLGANHTVETRLGDPPQYSLAMAIYGDMLLRKNDNATQAP